MSGLNHYAYCSTNPINYVDPIGMLDTNMSMYDIGKAIAFGSLMSCNQQTDEQAYAACAASMNAAGLDGNEYAENRFGKAIAAEHDAKIAGIALIGLFEHPPTLLERPGFLFDFKKINVNFTTVSFNLPTESDIIMGMVKNAFAHPKGLMPHKIGYLKQSDDRSKYGLDCWNFTAANFMIYAGGLVYGQYSREDVMDMFADVDSCAKALAVLNKVFSNKKASFDDQTYKDVNDFKKALVNKTLAPGFYILGFSQKDYYGKTFNTNFKNHFVGYKNINTIGFCNTFLSIYNMTINTMDPVDYSLHQPAMDINKIISVTRMIITDK